MRGLRSTIGLLVVLVGLGAYIYFVTWKKSDTDTTAKQDKVFAGLQADKIESGVSVGDDEVKAVLDRMNASKGTEEYRVGEIFLSATPATQAARGSTPALAVVAASALLKARR